MTSPEKAEYLAAFGIPMSDADRAKIMERDAKIVERWETEIGPNIVMRPTIRQWLRLLFVRTETIPIPRSAGLPHAGMTTMSGIPLHHFKHHDGRWFYRGPMADIGFPGS